MVLPNESFKRSINAGTAGGGPFGVQSPIKESIDADNQPDDLYLHDLSAYQEAIAATANGGKPLVIAFMADWSPPCQVIGPVYDQHIANYPELNMKKIDVDANKAAAQAARIAAQPTFKVFKDGVEFHTMRGSNQEQLVALLEKALEAPIPPSESRQS